jgi:hypothetical protein
MRSVFFAAAILLLMSPCISTAQQYDSPFEGDWKVEFSCGEGATGVYAERCKEGMKDIFVIFGLTQAKNQVCGNYVASIQLGNKVDEASDPQSPGMDSYIEGDTAYVIFGDAIAGGRATIQIKEGKLYWKVTHRWDRHILPNEAILTRDTTSRYQRVKCG